MSEKHKYTTYEDYTKAVDRFSSDKSVKTVRTMCNKTKNKYEIEVVRYGR